MKKIFLLFVLLLPVFSQAQHTSSRDTGIYYIDGERIPGGKTSAPPAATVRGIVADKSTGEPVVSALVYIAGISLGVQSDPDGVYSLTKIPPGTHHLVGCAAGYIKQDTLLRLDSGQTKTVRLFLSRDSVRSTGSGGGNQGNSQGCETPHKAVSREDIQKVPLSGKSVELYRPLKIYKWWQWRKKHRLRKQLKHMV